jgi:hypothetical protein
MPVLLLARGDGQAKDLLRAAIESRYGSRPPVFDALQVELKGRVLTRLGPVTRWLPVTASACYKAPLSFRWEYTVRAAGLRVHRGEYAYDGLLLRRDEGGEPAIVREPEVILSVQKRLWATLAILLMPLMPAEVALHAAGERTLEATNTETDDTIQLLVDEGDGDVTTVQTRCYNPQDDEEQIFKLALSDGYETVGDLALPAIITASWDDEPFAEFEPVTVTLNPDLDDAVFTLADQE